MNQAARSSALASFLVRSVFVPDGSSIYLLNTLGRVPGRLKTNEEIKRNTFRFTDWNRYCGCASDGQPMLQPINTHIQTTNERNYETKNHTGDGALRCHRNTRHSN